MSSYSVGNCMVGRSHVLLQTIVFACWPMVKPCNLFLKPVFATHQHHCPKWMTTVPISAGQPVVANPFSRVVTHCYCFCDNHPVAMCCCSSEKSRHILWLFSTGNSKSLFSTLWINPSWVDEVWTILVFLWIWIRCQPWISQLFPWISSRLIW